MISESDTMVRDQGLGAERAGKAGCHQGMASHTHTPPPPTPHPPHPRMTPKSLSPGHLEDFLLRGPIKLIHLFYQGTSLKGRIL